MVAGRYAGHALADALDDAGALVPQDGRERDRDVLIADGNVRVTNPHAGDADENLLLTRLVEREPLDGPGPPRFANDGGGDGNHGYSTPSS
jgi:hypothetical protein